MMASMSTWKASGPWWPPLPLGDPLRLNCANRLVQQCSGIDGMWGLRAGNEQLSLPIARRLAEQIAAAGGSVVAGDCNLANTAIAEQTGSAAAHPISLVARAYGIPEA